MSSSSALPIATIGELAQCCADYAAASEAIWQLAAMI
jgi:hypothetical protein